MIVSEIIIVSVILAAALGTAVAFVATRRAERKVAGLRARGLYPESGSETEQDIVRLLQSGEKIMAIRCYRSLHKVGLREAKDAVESLEAESAQPDA
jgi:ribosomal protein L7/L12